MTILNTNINLHWRKSLPEQSDPLNYPKCAKHVIEGNICAGSDLEVPVPEKLLPVEVSAALSRNGVKDILIHFQGQG